MSRSRSAAAHLARSCAMSFQLLCNGRQLDDEATVYEWRPVTLFCVFAKSN